MKKLHEHSKKIDQLGGTTEVARMFNIAPPSVCKWRRVGIPPARLMYLEVVYPSLFPRASKQNTEAKGKY